MQRKVKCQYCDKTIVVEVPEHIQNINTGLKGFSCNKCVPQNSPARDGINESIYTEVE